MSDPFLVNVEALDSFVRQWRECTLPKAAWTHSAHVAAAAYHALDLSAEELFSTMKHGINRFNDCTGTVSGPDSGYHETLTRFWSVVIWHFTSEGKFVSRLEAVRAAVTRFGPDRDLHKMYYSFDVVRDRRARREWVAPDRREANFHDASQGFKT